MTAEAAPRASGRVFVCYRREETAYPAGWLYDRLDDHFGDAQVFKDVDSIPLGDDFVEAITRAVGSCDVLLALIGDRWTTVTDERGQRRLDDPHDFVRLEIEVALKRNVRVIPVLVDGARMPRAEELPDSLAALARRNALELSPSRFETDTNRLVKVLESTLADLRAQQQPTAPNLTAGRTPEAGTLEVGAAHTQTEEAWRGPPPTTPPATGATKGDTGSPSAEGVPAGTRRRGLRWPIIAAVAVAVVAIGLIAAMIAGNGGDEDDASQPTGGIEVDDSTVTGPHGLQISGLDADVRNDPPMVNDTLTVSYSLKNVTDEPIGLEDTFVGVRNEADDNRDAENMNEGIVIEAGETVAAQGLVILDSEGTWRVWPCYTLTGGEMCEDLWRVFFVPVGGSG